MRKASLLLTALLAASLAWSQGRVVINELQASDRGAVPDWIELYNAGDAPVDLLGMRLALGSRQQVIDAPLPVPAKGHRVLWCDGRPKLGPDHMAFTLPRGGGTLLLIGPDGTTVADLFTWPALDAGISMGRLPDGAKGWSFFETPSPGSPNTAPAPVRARTTTPAADPPPGTFPGPFDLLLRADAGADVMYTTDGSAPSRTHGERGLGPVRITSGTVLRARAFAPGELPSTELCAAYTLGPRSGVALAMAPQDLFGDSGIYAPGTRTNHTRSGRAWERPAVVAFPGGDGAMLHVGARISGSGTRGLAKRSFKLYARNNHDSPREGLPFPDGTRFQEGILRADASPHAFLRNLLMETLVRRHGLRVDVQPSVPVPLHLNGRYWGLYRWMPAKDAAWLRHISGAAAVDVLEGPATVALSGSGAHFRTAQRALMNGAPADSIDALIDTGSLIDLACIDLWTGRADHDLNVRCHRPRGNGGRWRWVLFDMDLWAPATENSVERMCSAPVPESPYVPQLLAHPELRSRLLARMAALSTVVFASSSTQRLADSLFRTHAEELVADHRRWQLELEAPDPVASARELNDFIARRPEHLFRHLSARTGLELRTIIIEAPALAQGRLLLEGLQLAPGQQEVRCFVGVPMRLEALPAEGHEFAGWKGITGDAPLIIPDLSRGKRVRALFRPVVP